MKHPGRFPGRLPRRVRPRQQKVSITMGGYEEQLHARAELLEETGDLAAPRQAVPDAYAMAPENTCTGCQPAKAAAITAAGAAITAAEERIRDVTRRLALCEDSAAILVLLGERLQAARRALGQVPHDL